MAFADWLVMGGYFLIMVVIGVWSYRRIRDARDFFVAGGKMPWWLVGISHHMSGYSAAVFVAHAGVAYTYGFTLYVWLAVPVSLAIFAGAFLIAPRWARLRVTQNIVSPTEYLRVRYNLPTQQLLAWGGVILKIFDVGAKWAAIAVILYVLTGIPLRSGILISVGFSLFYITLGGLWAAAVTELAQFGVQFVAGIAMLVVVLERLGGVGAITGIWKRLPPGHSSAFNGPFTAGLALAYVLVCFLSYNGGTWNLAQRYIASGSGSQARKAAYLSAALYLTWPLVLFFPMWAAPLLFPNLPDPTQSYSIMAMNLLPPGLVGLVLASLFAHTMAMTTSDTNIIAAVVTRDILPVMSTKCRQLTPKGSLRVARTATVLFTVLTVIVAVKADSFGGILSLLVLWFGALVGPMSVPMILGLLPAFKTCNATAAIVSWCGGIGAFGIVKYGLKLGMAGTVFAPVAVSLILFSGIGYIARRRRPSPQVSTLLSFLDEDTLNTSSASGFSNQ